MAVANEQTDIKASLVLLAVTALALVIANSPLAAIYKASLDQSVTIGIGAFALTESLKGWIKNALMAVFFLYVGLEIKHEFTDGALADRQRATLPFAAAAGGIIVPALTYLAIAGHRADYVAGWAIPSATDIAFAVGVVGLLGPAIVPPSLKAFLLAVAVIDDLAAILIIAVAYSSGLSGVGLLLTAMATVALAALNRRRIGLLWPYLALGAVLWLCVLKAGINPTLAGVVTALFVPRRVGTTNPLLPLDRLMHQLKLPVLFVIMPIFAFANAGVSFKGLSLGDIAHPVTAGITVGLALGKPLGIMLAIGACIRFAIARLPDGATRMQTAGVACLAGIGFTMSLFIGTLAFGDGALLDQVRLGVLLGSLGATMLGVAVLYIASRRVR
jgi:Na+:H+ antiporter, NhaA family